MEQYINSIKEWKPKILELAEHRQKEMHDFIDDLIKRNPSISYQDAANTFLLLKLAKLEFELGRLWASQPSILDNFQND